MLRRLLPLCWGKKAPLPGRAPAELLVLQLQPEMPAWVLAMTDLEFQEIGLFYFRNILEPVLGVAPFRLAGSNN